MPIKIQSELPAKEILEYENIFVMDENRASHQDIRPLQVDVTFLMVTSHISLNTSANHLNRFYTTFDEIKEKRFDGLIITGAPVEDITFEEVDYWDEVCKIMDWAEQNVTSTLHICWGAQAGFYHYYGIQKRLLPEKLFGLYSHKVQNRKIPLVRGFDDYFLAPHSRHTETPASEIHKCDAITVLAESEEAGVFLAYAEEGKKIFVNGHPEYDRYTLDKEYHRDLDKGLPIHIPRNYYPNDDPTQKPDLQWRSHSNNLYTNWLNYYVYQTTPYEL